jgi:hypothetical protein
METHTVDMMNKGLVKIPIAYTDLYRELERYFRTKETGKNLADALILALYEGEETKLQEAPHKQFAIIENGKVVYATQGAYNNPEEKTEKQDFLSRFFCQKKAQLEYTLSQGKIPMIGCISTYNLDARKCFRKWVCRKCSMSWSCTEKNKDG